MARLTNGEQTSSFAQNIERNSLLRVPQFTLQDVEFVEELGEGAFGKLLKNIYAKPILI